MFCLLAAQSRSDKEWIGVGWFPHVIVRFEYVFGAHPQCQVEVGCMALFEIVDSSKDGVYDRLILFFPGMRHAFYF